MYYLLGHWAYLVVIIYNFFIYPQVYKCTNITHMYYGGQDAIDYIMLTILLSVDAPIAAHPRERSALIKNVR